MSDQSNVSLRVCNVKMRKILPGGNREIFQEFWHHISRLSKLAKNTFYGHFKCFWSPSYVMPKLMSIMSHNVIFLWTSSIVQVFDFLTFDIFLTIWHLYNLNHLSPSQDCFHTLIKNLVVHQNVCDGNSFIDLWHIYMLLESEHLIFNFVFTPGNKECRHELRFTSWYNKVYFKKN